MRGRDAHRGSGAARDGRGRQHACRGARSVRRGRLRGCADHPEPAQRGAARAGRRALHPAGTGRSACWRSAGRPTRSRPLPRWSRCSHGISRAKRTFLRASALPLPTSGGACCRPSSSSSTPSPSRRYDRKNYAEAAERFNYVLDVLNDPEVRASAAQPPLSDLRTLAMGFRDLAVTAATPPPAPPKPEPVPPPVAAPVAVAAAPAVPAAPRIYSPGDAGIVAPVPVRQVLPPFPSTAALPKQAQGVIEVVIDETGAVEQALIRVPLNAAYDRQALIAARGVAVSTGDAERQAGQVPQGRPDQHRAVAGNLRISGFENRQDLGSTNPRSPAILRSSNLVNHFLSLVFRAARRTRGDCSSRRGATRSAPPCSAAPCRRPWQSASRQWSPGRAARRR